jgi:hypothetical protein
MKHVPIALLIFVAPAIAEELPLNPAVTQATIGGTICKPGWTKTIRPPLRVTDQIKRDKLRAAGWTDADKKRFELDYIIPLSLGGAPNDPKNFQLEPGNEVVEKEALEACLPRLVCERRLMLDEASCLAGLARRLEPLPGLSVCASLGHCAALVGLGVADGNQGLAATFPSQPHCGVATAKEISYVKDSRSVRIGPRFR